jgi:anti-sigma factor RsiW
MTACEHLVSGDIELYFYGELEPGDRAAVARHLRSCAECRRALEEMSTIRSALESSPRVDAPPDGDWAPFMRRLSDACRAESGPAWDRAAEVPRVVSVGRHRAGKTLAPYLAMAALLALVTSGIVYVARTAPAPPSPGVSIDPTAAAVDPAVRPVLVPASTVRSADAAFAALSEQHFERSKLVVLGLTSRDPARARDADWAYERGLATNLLSDTRLYRMAAEERGMKTLAGVMGDLEIVLLQTSLADGPDAEVLGQIQRLIQKRDLVTKMDVASATAF